MRPTLTALAEGDVMFKRIVAVGSAALLGMVLVATPAQAAGSIEGTCTPILNQPRKFTVDVMLREENGDPYLGLLEVLHSENDDDWTLDNIAEATGVPMEFEVTVFPTGPVREAVIRVIAGDLDPFYCTVVYDPLLVFPQISGVTTVNLGDMSMILAHTQANPVGATNLFATLEVREGSEWVAKETVQVIAANGLAQLQYRPKALEVARVAYDRRGPGVDRRLGASAEFTFDVRYVTPTVTSKPSSVVQSKAATVVVRYGTSTTTGTAVLQRKSGSSWVTAKTAPLAAGTSTLVYTPSATYTYRVVVTPTGQSAKGSASFAITRLPAVSVKAPSSVRDNSNATITATHRLTKTGKGTLQIKSGSTWKTVKTFTLKSSGVTAVSTKVTKTAYYRVKVGSYYSASVKITAR